MAYRLKGSPPGGGGSLQQSCKKVNNNTRAIHGLVKKTHARRRTNYNHRLVIITKKALHVSLDRGYVGDGNADDGNA